MLKCCTSNQNELYTNYVCTSQYFAYSDDSDDENNINIDIQNQYTECSHNEIINKCKFHNNHIIQTKLLSDGSIFRQQDKDGIREYKR